MKEKKKEKKKDIRAIRLELVAPKGETWDTVGPTMRALAKATPKLLNAAMDALIAIGIVGRDAVKSAVSPDARAASADGLAYQAVLRAVERLREWGEKNAYAPFASLEVPGSMASAIARAASQAHARRDQGRVTFASERILVRASETSLGGDGRGTLVRIKLRPAGVTTFVVAHSWGAHRETLDAILSGKIPHGDCKLQWDKRRRKWYALVAHEMPKVEPRPIDPARALAVHRGVRNALYLLATTGERGLAMPGGKFMAQRRKIRARMRDVRRVSGDERGRGAKGRGRGRRYQSYEALGDKLARVTHTFCQQMAAFVARRARDTGCGILLLEDYGGMEPDEDSRLRRVLDHFPLGQMKEAIELRAKKDGITVHETPSAYISTTCPRCEATDAGAHNRQTGIFHCRACDFERPADWVAAYWMLKHGGADMSAWEARLRRERDLAKFLHNKEKEQDGEEKVHVRAARRRVQEDARKKRARRG